VQTRNIGILANMKWSRELRIARRSLSTAIKAASSMAGATARLPAPMTGMPWPPPAPQRSSNDLVEVAGFGSNPGRLAMFLHVPPVAPKAGKPLIVLLHGCGQTAARFAADTGWIVLADQLGIPLVLPEQSGDNNQGRCFNWFRPRHVRRGFGEALSIRQMVDTALARFDCDPRRVFVAGLSAGGAMAAALLAAYPDVFAGGAIVAGLPVGAASSATEALARMADAEHRRTGDALAQRVREAAPDGFAGPWPRVSIWHGLADDVVDPTNARLLAEQWTAVHGITNTMNTTEEDSARRTIWTSSERPAVELWMLSDLPHAWPAVAVDRAARFWGLLPG
jgi:poly(hydroxyalkanoate) depolymerase family esterase